MSRAHPGQTLQTTALVHEAYLKLVDATKVNWQDRVHFFAASAQIMRRILVDMARARGSLKRGGNMPHVNLNEISEISFGQKSELVAIDEALNVLAELDSRKARVIELRFFGGLSVEEIADVLKITPQSVMRDWRLAKAFLKRELSRPGGRL
jgi:RNA polymerase sigma-70 factor, ECF subfamily